MSIVTNVDFPILNGRVSAPTAAGEPQQRHGFYPYTDNGGSTLAIAGADFAIIAGDTRSTSGYSINTRFAPKLFPLGNTVVIKGEPVLDPQPTESAASTASLPTAAPPAQSNPMVLGLVGYAADGHAVKEDMDRLIRQYYSTHSRPMPIKAAAQRLSHLLYSNRFFPKYVHAILVGLDESGKGVVYSYDPVGSYEPEQCRAAGAASALMMPVLDNQVNLKNHHVPGSGVGHDLRAKVPEALPLRDARELLDDAFTSAVERHIEVGDYLQMMTVTRNGIYESITDLKKD